jgi:hypothetical protein
LSEVFPFFEKPENLERLTPSFLRFRILTPSPVSMHEGALIDYRLSLHGIPLRWQSRIEHFEPGHCFVDRQLKGPYELWVHRHEFAEHPEGTEIFDQVEYQLPLGPLGQIAHRVFVQRQLRQIFTYRQKIIESEFGRETQAEVSLELS